MSDRREREPSPDRNQKARESSPLEESVSSREIAVAAREDALRAREEAAQARAEVDGLMSQIREANEHLVIANLRSQEVAERMRQLYEGATAAIQAKEDFFATLSHELRTPLTSITGWAALLMRNPEPSTIVEAVQSIATSASLLAHLVDALLDVSRIMTGKFAITREEIDLAAVGNDAVSAMRPVAAAKGLSLQITSQQSIIINGDATRLRQVVSNLLSNATKFTPAGGLVEVRLLLDGSDAVIEVSDTGEGISSHFLPLVFERHAQAGARRFGGLGLGLAIVKHIVELHGGSVAAASRGEGKGATFTIRIPI